MENEVKEMCVQYVVPEEVLASDKLYQYYLEAVSQFKKVMYRELYTLKTDQLAALLKLIDENFRAKAVFTSLHFFTGEFVVMRKMAEVLVVRCLEEALRDN